MIDQSNSYMAFSIGRAGGLDEEHEDHQWLQTEMDRLDAEIRDSQHANLKRVRLRSPKRSKCGRPRKK